MSEENMQDHNRILAYCSDKQLNNLAEVVLSGYTESQIKILSGPRQGLVMLRVRESVADGQFNAGEVLVTEVRLELDDTFGFGMLTGNRPREAVAVALVDAAVRKGGPVADHLQTELERLSLEIDKERRQLARRVATTKVTFETY